MGFTGQFGDYSAMGRLGDGGRKCFIRKKRVLKYFKGYTIKDVCLISVFVVILKASDQCGSPSAGSLEDLRATVTMCGRKYGF